ncbi:MAG: diadenylate cyclase CdaA, partial [Christensenellales bacterium]
MGRLFGFFTQAGGLFTSLITRPDWRDWLDIALTTLLIYQLIKLLLRTRANSVFKGIAIILVMAWISDRLQLHTISWALQLIINTGIIVLVILFQPELRRGLDQIGRSRLTKQVFGTQRRQQARHSDLVVSEMVKALTNMSRKRIGALIVIERQTALSDIAESGTRVDAEISDALIENIFEPNTPLHDGAVLIRNERIVAAACILQLSDDHSISRELGTRHRAAIGMTESTDAVTLIVSEETGIISMAREGRL